MESSSLQQQPTKSDTAIMRLGAADDYMNDEKHPRDYSLSPSHTGSEGSEGTATTIKSSLSTSCSVAAMNNNRDDDNDHDDDFSTAKKNHRLDHDEDDRAMLSDYEYDDDDDDDDVIQNEESFRNQGDDEEDDESSTYSYDSSEGMEDDDDGKNNNPATALHLQTKSTTTIASSAGATKTMNYEDVYNTSDNGNDAVADYDLTFQHGYRFWKTPQLRQFMRQTIQEATDLLCMPPEATAILLRKFKWDCKQLTEEFFKSTSSTNNNIQKQDLPLLVECGVFERCQNSAQYAQLESQSISASLSSSKSSCPICFEDDLEVFAMDCGHAFCRDCWRAYLAEAVSQGPCCVNTQCAQPKCTAIVTEKEVVNLAADAEIAKFLDYQLRNFVETNYRMRWCPGPSCDAVAVIGSSYADGLASTSGSASSNDNNVTCLCGADFCFKCGEWRHVPATCDMIAVWNEKCQGESETANWMIVHTKKCPNCSSRIDKNGGCNRINCAHCNYQFCWMCMQDWKVHGYKRSCFQSELDRVQTMDSQRDHAERELERYLHCFKRYQNHSQGQTFAQTELDKFGEQQENLEKTDFSFDWNALKAALEQLVECRRVLKFTYVVTYNLANNPIQRDLFHEHQAVLERFTEMLSEITEKNYQKIERNELVTLTATVARYAKSVMECGVEDEDHDARV